MWDVKGENEKSNKSIKKEKAKQKNVTKFININIVVKKEKTNQNEVNSSHQLFLHLIFIMC